MSQSRLEIKVGVFMLIGLVLLGALALLFSKGTAFYQQTFALRLKSSNVGGIKVGANVLLSGVPVGRVSSVGLDPDGKSVTIHLKIFQKYRLFDDSRFELEQFGFLGDQFVVIYPGANQGRQLRDGAEVQCRTPFNMQEAVASATETISRIGQAATNLNAAVTDVRRFVLNQQTLTNLAVALDRFALLSAEAFGMVSNLNALIESNSLPVTAAVSNLNQFSAQLTPLTSRANALLADNEAQVGAAIKNIETASGMLTNLLHDLQAGRGLAGRVLRDEALAAEFAGVASNLSVTSSNLNRLGLWGILWKRKEPATNLPAARAVTTAPHDPFR